MFQPKWRLLVALLAVAFLIGCTASTNRPKTVKVTGTVTYNGQAVEGATVTFGPASAEGHAASGKTNASGQFTLSTFEQGDGAVPGTYIVTIFKTEGEPAPSGGTETDIDAAYRAAEAQGVDVVSGTGGGAASEVKDLLPTKYKDPGSTPFKGQEVTETGENNFTFNLED